jgi:hypothetical protein
VNRQQIPSILLTHEEFAQLSTDEKIAYLVRAVEALAEERGAIFAGLSARPTRTLQ